jgi:uncharacterized protein YkwD
MQGKYKISLAVIIIIAGTLALTFLYNWRGQVIDFSPKGTQKITITKAGHEQYPFILIEQQFIDNFAKRLSFRPFHNLTFEDLSPQSADYQLTFNLGQGKSQVLYYWKKENYISYNGKNYVPFKDFVNILEEKIQILEKKLSPAAVKNKTYSDDELLIFALLNLERKKAKVKPLKADFKLTQLARMKSQDMINLDYLGHISPTFGNYNDMITTTGTTFYLAGENVISANTPQGCFEIMMKDKPQRDLILKGDFTKYGVGIVPGGKYGYVLSILLIAQ